MRRAGVSLVAIGALVGLLATSGGCSVGLRLAHARSVELADEVIYPGIDVGDPSASRRKLAAGELGLGGSRRLCFRKRSSGGGACARRSRRC